MWQTSTIKNERKLFSFANSYFIGKYKLNVYYVFEVQLLVNSIHQMYTRNINSLYVTKHQNIKSLIFLFDNIKSLISYKII